MRALKTLNVPLNAERRMTRPGIVVKGGLGFARTEQGLPGRTSRRRRSRWRATRVCAVGAEWIGFRRTARVDGEAPGETKRKSERASVVRAIEEDR